MSERFDIQRPSKAVYGDLTWKATDKLTVAVGLRYTMDKVKFRNGSTIIYALDGVTPVVNLIPYAFPMIPDLPTMNLPGRGEPPDRPGQYQLSVHRRYHGLCPVQPRLSQRQLPDGLAYQGTNQVYYITPEKVNAYEGGLTAQFLDRLASSSISRASISDFRTGRRAQGRRRHHLHARRHRPRVGRRAELTIAPVDGLQLRRVVRLSQQQI